MASWPSDSVRTKNWGTETLTDTDLEGQIDLLHTWVNDALDETSGHKHDGTTNEGPQIDTDGLAADCITGAKIEDDAVGAEHIELQNNTYLTAANAAGDGTVSLIKANASDVPVLPDGTELASSAAPTSDADVANKKYVDDTALSFGSWVDKSADYGAQQATTDGFVVCYATGNTNSTSDVRGYTDGNADPTTIRCRSWYLAAAGEYLSFTMPVKKNDYWKITAGASSQVLTVYWIPLS